MARSYGQLLTSIWDDPDFVELASGAQRLYLFVLSQRDLNACGVLPWRPKLWASKAPDLTAPKVVAAGRVLHAARFVILDETTGELCVRTFMRHDGVLRSPNIFKSACRQFDAIHSSTIRAAIVEGLPEGLREGFPKGFLDTHPKGLAKVLREGLAEPLLDHSLHPPPSTRNPKPEALHPTPDTVSSSSTTHAGNPQAAVDDDEAKFWEDTWDAYTDARFRATLNVSNPRPWKATTRANGISELCDEARRLRSDFDLTASELGRVLAGERGILRHARRREAAS